MGVKYTNNAKTTISSGINNSVTTIPVASSSGFPSLSGSDYFYATLDDATNLEVVKVTAVSGTNWTVVRAQDDTTARAWSSGDDIELRLNAALLTDVVNDAMSDAFTRQAFTGDGSETDFTLSKAPATENDLIVFIEGVFQTQSAYSVSGTTLTFSAAPANSREIIVYNITAAVNGDSLSQNNFTGDGSDTTFTLGTDPLHENNTMVFLDGVYQHKSTYSVSGTTLTFSTAPASGVAIECITHTQTEVNTPASNSVVTASIVDDNVTQAKIADDAVGADQLAASAVVTASIVDDNVTQAKIADDAVGADQLASSAVVTASIVDDAVTTAKIADDQVTLAKMAGLARGKIIYGDSSGNPAALALGSNGQVLKSDGTDIAWATDATVAALTSEEVQDIVGAMFSSNTETGITATYQDGDGTVDLVVGTLNQDTTGTAATVTGAAQTNITSLGTLTALTVDDITIDGSTISDGGDFTLDVGGDISLSADDNGEIHLYDGGLHYGSLLEENSNLLIRSIVDNEDILFQGYDATVLTTALTLDMSKAGSATFNHDVILGDNGQAIFGAGDDLTIYHDGSDSYIKDTGTGNLLIQFSDLYMGDGSNHFLVVRDNGSTGNVLINNTSSIANASLDDLQVGSGSGNTGMTIYSGTSNYGGIAFADGNTGASDQYPGLIEYYHNDNSMRFYTGSSERMRIDEDNSTGVVGINTTNLAQSNHFIVQGGTSEQYGKIRVRSQVAAGSTAPGGHIEFAGHHAGTGDGTRIFARIIGKKENNTGGAVGGRIEMYVNNSSGSLTEALKIEDDGTVYTTGGTVTDISSDARVKDDVQDLTDGLTILKQLKPRTFKYNTKYSSYFPHHATETQYGFVADEVKAVAPQYTETKVGMIDGTEVDDMKTLSMTKMIPMLVKAIQEQQTIIDDLKSRIETLEG
tara:strand:+ start:10296 stop:13064 length:2769 start_codon:yes stop_codon:yes gene_type:complete